ncbi:hypothetical protein M427DRAFT_59551 [Gonapodya prolifera JEL478]|uniref:2Fe-2S ferredoxin-type domain-containing protein n=1 Tax=Gonapodya prolifera (strain JEL478) TaxID=1344416 RepID=A0A139A6X6_GONPJ|nr:hypothetical protein M427DRAFT_59551 [Gonapodya prolifera JEL478]|eukprot:KXS12398.1 hypothetical protein M427DRAFT_59551 [Gonapodya prolifera JEL478]
MTELLLLTRKLNAGGLGIKITACDIPSASSGEQATVAAFNSHDARNTNEAFDLHVFPDHILIHDVSRTSLPLLSEFLSSEPSEHGASVPPIPLSWTPLNRKTTRLFICTHGERDCRCGETGEAVYQKLATWARSRGDTEVEVWRTSHVGGHQWAANVIAYPSGDWFGNLTPTTAVGVVGSLQSTAERSAGSQDQEQEQKLTIPWDAWRGRVGLSQVEIERLHCRETKTWSRNFYQAPPTPALLTPTIAVHFSSPTHGHVTVMGYPGERLLDAAKRAELGMEAACGGEMECATCQVLVDDTKGELPSASEDELDALDSYAHPKATNRSRLACQIRLTHKMTQFTVELPS